MNITDYLKIIITCIISSGIVGFIIKNLIEKSINNSFQKNLENYKSNLDIKKNISQQINTEQVKLYKKITEIIYRSRNQTRYVLSLLGYYCYSISNESYYNKYSQYLENNDNILTFKEILLKITENLKFLENSIKESTELSFENRLFIGDLVFRYVHDYKYFIYPLVRLDDYISRINKSDTDFKENLKKIFTDFEKAYEKMDLFYKEIVVALQANYNIEI
jgi:hypothetical protein